MKWAMNWRFGCQDRFCKFLQLIDHTSPSLHTTKFTVSGQLEFTAFTSFTLLMTRTRVRMKLLSSLCLTMRNRYLLGAVPSCKCGWSKKRGKLVRVSLPF